MHTESRMALSEIEDWMNALVPEQRAALVLSVFEGMSNAEVAQIMGCPRGPKTTEPEKWMNC